MHPNMISQAANVAQHGSPVILHAAGRMLGFGQAEQNALVNGKLPFWLWVVFGVGAGWVIGVQAQKRGWLPGYLSTKRGI